MITRFTHRETDNPLGISSCIQSYTIRDCLHAEAQECSQIKPMYVDSVTATGKPFPPEGMKRLHKHQALMSAGRGGAGNGKIAGQLAHCSINSALIVLRHYQIILAKHF